MRFDRVRSNIDRASLFPELTVRCVRCTCLLDVCQIRTRGPILANNKVGTRLHTIFGVVEVRQPAQQNNIKQYVYIKLCILYILFYIRLELVSNPDPHSPPPKGGECGSGFETG